MQKTGKRAAPSPLPTDDDLAAFLSGFHSVALATYVLTAAETNQCRPDSELTRRRA